MPTAHGASALSFAGSGVVSIGRWRNGAGRAHRGRGCGCVVDAGSAQGHAELEALVGEKLGVAEALLDGMRVAPHGERVKSAAPVTAE